MSLVVGRTTPRGIRMTGDMRVTDPNATRSGYLEATLKTVLISPTLCVGYAGSVGAAMRAVVEGPSRTPSGEVMIPRGGQHASVGEAVVNVVPRVEDGLLKYAEIARTESGLSGSLSSDAGSAPRGGFSYSILTPEQPGVGAIGLYFYEGRVGILYAPLLSDYRRVHPQMSQSAFVEVVRLRYGINLSGF